jgi:ribosomal protein S18 acetylase RimI-like enzyme
MLNISIIDVNLQVKNIDKESMRSIYSIYGNTVDFKYATGINDFITFEMFSYELSRFLSQENAFFLDISNSLNGITIGLVKGSLAKAENILWLHSLAIDKPFQSKGYGRRVIQMLENYFKQYYNIGKMCLSVSKNNSSGMNFWKKCGFTECDFISLEDFYKQTENVQIMWKKL